MSNWGMFMSYYQECPKCHNNREWRVRVETIKSLYIIRELACQDCEPNLFYGTISEEQAHKDWQEQYGRDFWGDL